MPNPIRVSGSPLWQSVSGILCAILKGHDDKNNEVSIAVPASAFQVLAAEARRRLAAAKSTTDRQVLPPEWHHVKFLSMRTMLLGATDNQRVGVILDRGLDTEFGLSFAPQDARELARRLIAEADKFSEKPRTVN